MKTIKYLTTPIYYPNNTPHVGHLYSSLLVDVWKKAAKLLNRKHYFTTGLDEHGQKVAQAAAARGYSAQEHVNHLSAKFIEFFQHFNIEWDYWVRTTSVEHKMAVQNIWMKLKNNGYIYKGNYAGWYSISDETYLAEKPEQESEHIVWREEDCYFFKLSALEDQLKKFYEEHPDFVYPNKRYNEAMGFLQNGLKDFVISRPKNRLYWGIEVPDDSDHVIYVWIDALVNYISAVGYPNEEEYKHYWPGKHVLGKDILKFHAIYWPAILMATQLPLPEKLIVHGWWMRDDAKISKSLGNAVPLDDLITKYQVDGIRYFLLRGIELGEDGQFREDILKGVVHGDLANKYGNIFLRMLGIIELRFGGALPNGMPNLKTKEADALRKTLDRLYYSVDTLIDEPETMSEYLNRFIEVIVQINDYFQNNKIWEIEDKVEQAANLYFLMDIFRKATVLISPVLTNSANAVMKFLGFPECSMKYYDSNLPLEYISNRPRLFPKI